MNDVIENGATVANPQKAVTTRQSGAVTPGELLRIAVDQGADLARLEKLMDLQQRFEENEARKAYVSDMAAFKLNAPDIVKDKTVAYSGTSYTHATLGNVTRTIIEGLAKHGFSHRWDTEQQGVNVIVTCILTHRLGHSERTTLTAPKDDSGKKNGIQQMASAITYLQRYTLLAATGLATQDQDDDGVAAELDTALADKWIAKANAAKTDEEAVAVWNDGIVEIERAKDRHAYKEFKDAIAARRAMLGGAA